MPGANRIELDFTGVFAIHGIHQQITLKEGKSIIWSRDKLKARQPWIDPVCAGMCGSVWNSTDNLGRGGPGLLERGLEEGEAEEGRWGVEEEGERKSWRSKVKEGENEKGKGRGEGEENREKRDKSKRRREKRWRGREGEREKDQRSLGERSGQSKCEKQFERAQQVLTGP